MQGVILRTVTAYPGVVCHGKKVGCGDQHGVDASYEHVQQKQHEVPVVQVAHAVVHPWAVVVHLLHQIRGGQTIRNHVWRE